MVIYLCAMGINFASFYELVFGGRGGGNCSHIVVCLFVVVFLHFVCLFGFHFMIEIQFFSQWIDACM